MSNIEAIQSQLQNIYTNTLSTLCPLPWLEEAEDVQYNFDDVFIPLRTIDIPIQQKVEDLSGPPDCREYQGNQGNQHGPSNSNDDEEQTNDLSESLGELGLQYQTRYKYDNIMLLLLYIIINCI